MSRKAKGVHTSPEKAGVQNLPENYVETHKNDPKSSNDLMTVWNKGFENRENYKGQWTEETFAKEIDSYLQFCFTKDVKPCKAGLALWLGTSKQQLWDWETHKEKYGFKSELIRDASQVIEMSYIGRVESFPTGNIFLLKTSHGHIETSKMDVTTNGKDVNNADEVNDLVSKLGLDKKTE